MEESSETEFESPDKGPESDALCVKWQGIIKKAYKDGDGKRRRWKQNRTYARGIQHEDGDENAKLTRANLLYVTMYKLIAHLYAKNPEISAKPDLGDDVQAPPALIKFGSTLEKVLNVQLKDAQLKKRAKSILRSAFEVQVGWAKVTYQRDYYQDPEIANRIADTQDNLAKLNQMIEEIEEGEGCGDLEAKKAELEELVQSLEAQVEVEVASGLTVDKIAREDLLIDPAVREFEDYPNSRWMAQRVWIPLDRAKEKAPKDFPIEKATTYKWSSLTEEQAQGRKDGEDDSPVCVWEIWDRESMTIKTLMEGVQQWYREPYTLDLVGDRFYPFFGLAFYLLDGEIDPLSLIELLAELQDEYNTTRTQLSEHRQMGVPHYIADKSTDVETIERKQVAQLGEVVLVDANGKPLNEVIKESAPPNINAAVYDTSPIRQDWELVSMLHDAAQGQVLTAKTATEAEFLQEALQTGVAEMRDQLEDFLQEIAEYAAEILLLELSPAEAQEIAGVDAVWPDLDREQIYRKLQIQLRAGSTGKPNKAKEQEQWQALYPLLKQAIMEIRQLMAQGIDTTPERELLKELLNRFDERIDLSRFLPQLPPTPAPVAEGDNTIPFPVPQEA